MFNGVPLATTPFGAVLPPTRRLCFLAAWRKSKAPTSRSNREAGRRRLVIAGNVPPEHRGWFDRTISRMLTANGYPTLAPWTTCRRTSFWRGVAFLMPILWDEPFGIVMTEAMACGTPVLGLARGAVSEVIEHGVTGFVSDDVTGLVEAVSRLGEIDRASCRSRVERLFSDAAVTEAYLAVYRDMVAVRAQGRAVA